MGGICHKDKPAPKAVPAHPPLHFQSMDHPKYRLTLEDQSSSQLQSEIEK